MPLRHLCHHSKPAAAGRTGIPQVQLTPVTAHMPGMVKGSWKENEDSEG